MSDMRTWRRGEGFSPKGEPTKGVVLCTQCRQPVEYARECYFTPMCYACLPPPEPLPIAVVRPAQGVIEVELLKGRDDRPCSTGPVCEGPPRRTDPAGHLFDQEYTSHRVCGWKPCSYDSHPCTPEVSR
jgi:hypothetical protein